MSRADSVSSNDKTLQFHDGRTIGYAEYGLAEGKALFYFHGYPGARVEAEPFAEYAARAGIRLISVDRPGMGLSSFQPGRHFLDWPGDVVELADCLHLDRFAVVGVSGGGPYALACAYKIPERLTACGIVSGIGPLELGIAGMPTSQRLILFICQRLPWLLTPLLRPMRRLYQDEEKARESFVKNAREMVEPDRKCFLIPEVGACLAASTVEAFRQGVKGVAYEGTLYGRPWGFRFEDIAFNALYLWHGGLDTIVPVAMGLGIAGKLAHCQAVFYPEEGHFSVIVTHGGEIMTTLIS